MGASGADAAAGFTPRRARFSGDRLVLLPDQDRNLWDTAEIEEGRMAVDRALALGGRGQYLLQAAIAELHTHEPVDWTQIAALYTELGHLTGSPVVELNRAVAIAELHGPGPALCVVETLDLDGYAYYHSTRAELLRRLGRNDEALTAYTQALDFELALPERRLLERRVASLRA